MSGVPSGRRRDVRAAILEAAGRLFAERGYAGTSMDAVARTAGISKATLYHHVAGKDALFALVVEERARRLVTAMEDADHPLPEVLAGFARRFVDLVADPDSLALYRMVIAESVRRPDLARRFHEAGPVRVRRHLAALFARAVERGELAPVDPQRAAERFLSLLLGPWQMQALLGLGRPDAAFLEGWAAEAVELFLRAFAPESGAPGRS